MVISVHAYLDDPEERYVGNRLVHADAWVAFDRSGAYMATVGPRGCIEVRRLDDGSVVSLGEPGQFHRFQFDWTGQFLISAGWYVRKPSRLRAGLFEIRSAHLVGECENFGLPALHPGGRVVASAVPEQGESEIFFHRLTDRLENFSLKLHDTVEITGLSFSPRGRELAVTGQDDFFAYAVVDFPSCTTRFSKGYELTERHYAPFSLCRECIFSADGKTVFFAFPTGHIVQLDSQSGDEVSRWRAHDGSVTTMSIRHDLHLLASGGVDGKINLWQLPATAPPGPAEARAAAAEFEAAHEIVTKREPPWQLPTIQVEYPECQPPLLE
jgi:WD40 repeat protein